MHGKTGHGKQGVGLLFFMAASLYLCVPLFAADGDWIYEAGSLIERFEKTAALERTQLNSQDKYQGLLEDCRKFAETRAESERDRRARNLVSLWMQLKINEQLGNAGAIRRARDDYAKTIAALPEDEKGLLLFLERSKAEASGLRSSFCHVETRGKEVRVAAVDYPVSSLLEKIATALGGEIKVSSNVSGRTDLGQDRLSEGWVRPGFLISRFARTRGLLARGDVTKSLEIFPADPLYMASLAERVRKQTKEDDRVSVEGGIKTGYLIMKGVYVAPPYKVELRTAGDKCAVYVNGMQVGADHHLGLPKPGVLVPVDLSKPFTLSDRDKTALVFAAHEMYIKLSKTRGHAEAIASIGRFLDGEKVVKSWKMDKNRNELWITFTDGEPMSAMLPWPKSGAAPSAGDSRAAFRKKGLAEAEKAKAGIEGTLQSNGLVIVPSNGAVCRFKGERAQRKLRAICYALEQTLRLEEQLCDHVFDAIYPDPQQWAWEIFLNIRHRELTKRMTSDGLM